MRSLILGALTTDEARERLQRLHAAQQIEHAVQHADVAIRRDDDRAFAFHRHGAKDEAVVAGAAQRITQPERRDDGDESSACRARSSRRALSD